MYIQEISNKLVDSITTAETESQTLWTLNFRDGNIECAEVKIAPESNIKIVHERQHSYLSFNRYQGQSLLVLDFSLNENPNGEMLLNMNGSANAFDTKNCYFDLRVNGEFVQEFRAIDDYVGNGWRGDTHISIPSHFLHQGKNIIEIAITNRSFPAYMLTGISMMRQL